MAGQGGRTREENVDLGSSESRSETRLGGRKAEENRGGTRDETGELGGGRGYLLLERLLVDLHLLKLDLDHFER